MQIQTLRPILRRAALHTGASCSHGLLQAVQSSRAEIMDTVTEQDGDDVDKLFAQYEAEAAADRAKVESKVKKQSQKPNLSMKDIREAGLSAPIGHDNRGFRMLAAMGYQPGQGIGKGQTGRAAPVPVEVKGGRQGLGIEENRKRKKVRAEEQRKQNDAKRIHVHQQMQADHKMTSAIRAANRQAEAQLTQARQVCETLDRREGLESSELWPQLPAAATDDTDQPLGEDQDQIATDAEPSWEDWPVQAKLAHVLDHLRQSYSYCLYCGCQYKDQDDLLANCPGLMEDDH